MNPYYALPYMGRTHLVRNLTTLGGACFCGMGIPYDYQPCDFPAAPVEEQPLCQRCEEIRRKRQAGVFRLEAQS